MDPQEIAPLVSVVIPTTGNPQLKDALESVQSQIYQNIQCLVVIDGVERERAARQVLDQVNIKESTHIITLPYATGKNRFQGHRIYGASIFLTDGDFLVFLDEDNWLDADHILSLTEIVKDRELDWAYALRKMTTQAGEFLINDECLNTGKWPCFAKKNDYDHHIDTGWFFLSRELAIHCAHIWHRQSPPEKDPDTTMANYLMKNFPNNQCTGRYSLNYRAESTEHSGSVGYIFYGNARMKHAYESGYPWHKADSFESLVKYAKREFGIKEKAFICFPDWQYEHQLEKLGNKSTLKPTIEQGIGQLAAAESTAKVAFLLFATSQWYTRALALKEAIQIEEPRIQVSVVTEMTAQRWAALRSQLTGQFTLPSECPNTQDIRAYLAETSAQSDAETKDKPLLNAAVNPQYPRVHPKQTKHFLLLSHPGAQSSVLAEFINSQAQLHNAGEIFFNNPGHPDVAAMRQTLSKEREFATFIDVPDFLRLRSQQTNCPAVGFTLLTPHVHTLQLKTVNTLIESGLKIIYLRHQDLTQTLESAQQIADSKEDADTTAPLTTAQQEEWLKGLAWYLTNIEHALAQRDAPFIQLRVNDTFTAEGRVSESAQQKVATFLS